MLETAMIIVMCVGGLAMIGLMWLGSSKAHSPKNRYIERARWPLERYGRPTQADIDEADRADAGNRRFAYLAVGSAAATGLIVGFALFDGAVAALAAGGVSYVAIWVFLLGGGWLRRRLRPVETE